MIDFHVFTDAEELSRTAAYTVRDLALQAVEARGRFTIALSGGSTPRRLFEILADTPFREEMPWEHIVVFWGDDRAVGPDHEWSNYKLAHDTLLSHVPVPVENVYRVSGEDGAKAGAQKMIEDLKVVFGDADIPQFDLVLQGMGGDGHTASLFPGTETLDATDWVVPVFDPPANPAVDRVTLTFPVLNAARVALFLAAGEGKRSKLSEIMNDPTAWDRYPAARVEAEQTLWLVDEAAFGLD